MINVGEVYRVCREGLVPFKGRWFVISGQFFSVSRSNMGMRNIRNEIENIVSGLNLGFFWITIQ